MDIVPAIDISGGKCVRLFKGKKGTEKVYFKDPIKALDFWMEKGIKRIHFVDLDGAWGSEKNKMLIEKMVEMASESVKVQLGGGIRSIEDAVSLIDKGVDRVIIGTLAIKQPEVIRQLSDDIGSEHLIVALDYRSGKIETDGWTKGTDLSPFVFGKEVEELGAGFILFSAIEADGAFTGPDFKNIKKMVETVNIPIYAAGGIRDTEDLKKLNEIGVWGVIIGKAFYEEKIPFSIINEFLNDH